MRYKIVYYMSLKLIVSPDPSYSFPLFYFIILFNGIRGAVRTTSCTIMPLWVGLCCVAVEVRTPQENVETSDNVLEAEGG